MGPIQSAFKNFFGKRDVRICVVGLDAAGKSVFLQRCKLGETVTTIPTIGFTVETVTYKSLNFTMWDIGGQQRLRSLWRHYYQGCDAVIWVVDASDRARVGESFQELQHVLSDDQLRNATLLVYANKQDLPNALRPAELADAFKMPELCRGRKYWVQGSCFTTGTGIFEGLDWLSNNLPPKQG